MLKFQNEGIIHIFQRNILQITFYQKHFFQIPDSTFISKDCSFHIILAHKFTILFVVLTEYFQQHFGRITFTVEHTFQNFRIDRLVVLWKFTINLIDFGTYHFKILVQFQCFPILANGTSLGSIPFVIGDTALDLQLGTLAVYRNSQTDRCFTVLQQPGSSDEEKNRKIVSLHCHTSSFF